MVIIALVYVRQLFERDAEKNPPEAQPNLSRCLADTRIKFGWGKNQVRHRDVDGCAAFAAQCPSYKSRDPDLAQVRPVVGGRSEAGHKVMGSIKVYCIGNKRFGLISVRWRPFARIDTSKLARTDNATLQPQIRADMSG